MPPRSKRAQLDHDNALAVVASDVLAGRVRAQRGISTVHLLDQWVAERGGIEMVITTLEYADDDRAKTLAEDLRYNPDKSIASLLRRSSLTVRELDDLYLPAALARSRADTTAIQARLETIRWQLQEKHLPQVIEDTLVDAKSRSVKCLDCRGTGRLKTEEGEIECLRCEGMGRTRKVGDIRSREMALRAGGVIKDAGTTVTTNIPILNLQGTNVPRLEDVLAKAEVVSAEVVRQYEPKPTIEAAPSDG